MPRRRHPNWPLRALGLALLAVLLGYIVLFPAASFQSSSDHARRTPAWIEAPSLGEVMRNRAVEGFTVVWFFSIGASIGSFLNVVVYRMPRGVTLIHQASRCPRCETKIRATDNLPVVGWLMLRGRCRTCRLPISPRYPLVELTVGLVFAALLGVELATAGGNLPLRETTGPSGLLEILISPRPDLLRLFCFHVCLLCVLLGGALMQWDEQPLPRRFLVFAGLVGLLAPAIWPDLHPVPWRIEQGEGALSTAWLSRIDTGLIGCLAGAALGSVLDRILTPARRVAVGQRNQPRIAFGLSIVGIYLGWQAVIAVAAMAVVLRLVVLRLVSVGSGRAWERLTRSPLWGYLFFAALLQMVAWRITSTWSWWPGPNTALITIAATIAATIGLAMLDRFFLSRFKPDPLSPPLPHQGDVEA